MSVIYHPPTSYHHRRRRPPPLILLLLLLPPPRPLPPPPLPNNRPYNTIIIIFYLLKPTTSLNEPFKVAPVAGRFREVLLCIVDLYASLYLRLLRPLFFTFTVAEQHYSTNEVSDI